MLTYSGTGKEQIKEHEKEVFYSEVYSTFEDSAEAGIYEAYYFLGIMNLKGLYTKVNKKKAFFYLTLAASCSHSLSYFEMYKL